MAPYSGILDQPGGDGHHSMPLRFVERLWRAVKYEDISIQGYEAVPELRHGLARYFAFDNGARLHQALGYRTPAAVYAMPVPCGRRLSLPTSEG